MADLSNLTAPDPPPLNRLLKMAVMTGVASAVQIHIQRGDDINARDDRGMTPLMLAASKDKSAICRLLLDANADPRLIDPAGRDALAIAKEFESHKAAAVIEVALANVSKLALALAARSVSMSLRHLDA